MALRKLPGALLLTLLLVLSHLPTPQAQSPTKDKWPSQAFETFNWSAPVLSYTKTATTAPGVLFFAPIGQDADNGGFDAPTIMTDEGDLIWRPESDTVNGTRNFGVQSLNGTDVLTYWTGDHNSAYGLGYGAVIILDQSYQQIYNVCLADANITTLEGQYFMQPCRLDSHESRITARGTLLATVRSVVSADLSSVGGPVDGWLLDSIFYDIDIATQTVLFRWSAYEHNDQLPVLKYSTYPQAGDKKEKSPWDFFHMNAVDDVPSPAEGYVISSRYLDSAIKINMQGDIEWFLRGTDGGNFTLPTEGNFSFQHDVLASNVTSTSLDLTMFDNANRDITVVHKESSGLSLHLDLSTYTATVNRRLNPDNFTASPHTGSYQTIPDSDHVLLDYGHPPILNEFDGANNLIYVASVSSLGGETYRAYKKPWSATPKTSPVLLAQSVGSSQTRVYVSWNGATDVQSWSFSAGSSCTGLKTIGNSTGTVFAKTGFETVVLLDGSFTHVQATALGASAEDVLGLSPTVVTGATDTTGSSACAASATPSISSPTASGTSTSISTAAASDGTSSTTTAGGSSTASAAVAAQTGAARQVQWGLGGVLGALLGIVAIV